jgi:RecJ-like exonuclease
MDDFLIDDECMRRLLPSLDSCAKKIMGWLDSGRLVIVRFNDDCDGITSGLEVYLACKAYCASGHPAAKQAKVAGFQVPSAVYSLMDAYSDVTRARDAGKKLAVVITDLGANAESVEGLTALRDASAGICIIDHHPPSKDALAMCDCHASSHPFDPLGAHTAGLVAYEVARRIDEGAARPEWVRWSLQSDKSTLADGEDHEEARALDYLAHFSQPDSPADYYLEKISDSMAIHLASELARKSEKKALRNALRHSEETSAGPAAFMVATDLAKTLHNAQYPPKGRCLNLVQDYFAAAHDGSPVVSIGYADDSASMRANAAAIAAGFHSNPVISELKKEFPRAIRSGGGHAAAASIRFDPAFKESVLDRLSELVLEKLGGKKKK